MTREIPRADVVATFARIPTADELRRHARHLGVPPMPDVDLDPSDEYLDPLRLMRAARARIEEAIDLLTADGVQPLGMLHALEKAHYRLETAQREIAADYLEERPASAWQDVADAVQMKPGQARARFRNR
jgi:hypothetical protein